MYRGWERGPSITSIFVNCASFVNCRIKDTDLILSFEHEHIGDPAEGQAQLYDLRLCRLVGYVSYVNDAGRLAHILFQFHLLTKLTLYHPLQDNKKYLTIPYCSVR